MRKCKQCGAEKDFRIYGFCSYKCYEEWAKFNMTHNAVCVICGKSFYMKPSHIKAKKHGTTCSIECSNINRAAYCKGAQNHQYGLVGNKNASFKKGRRIRNNNKFKETVLYVPGYKGYWAADRAEEHRYNVEMNYRRFNPDFFEELDGFMYLKKGIEVHHIDLNHNNNDISNLMPMTVSEHRRLHGKLVNRERNKKGQFIKD